jgi:hypothetical protein
MAIGRDQEFLCKFINHYLKTPDLGRELPSQVVVLDVNWANAPWANIQQQEQPASWTEKGKPVLIVLPSSPGDASGILGPWLVNYVPQNRNMIRFLLPKADLPEIFADRSLLITARCALLAREWQQTEPQYRDMQKRFEAALSTDLKSRFDRYALLATWNFQTPSACTFHVDSHGSSGSDISAGVEKHVRENHFAPEDFEKITLEAAGRGDSMRQLLTQLREPPLPGELAIPYLGDLPVFESVLRIVAKGKIAVNAGGRWYGREPDESYETADVRLRQRLGAFSGQAMLAVQLGDVSQVGGGGVAVPASPTQPISQPLPSVMPQPLPGGTTPPYGPQQPSPFVPTPMPIPDPVSAPPVVRRSMGAKTGINLLGDLEKWALPDSQKATQASLTFNGLTVKEIRDLCLKLPPKLQAELQVILPPENGNAS